MKKLLLMVVFSQIVFSVYGKDDNRIFTGTLPGGSIWIGNVRPSERLVNNLTVLPDKMLVSVVNPYPESNYEKVMRRSKPGRIYFDRAGGRLIITGTFSGSSGRSKGEGSLPDPVSVDEVFGKPPSGTTTSGEGLHSTLSEGNPKLNAEKTPVKPSTESPSSDEDIRVISDPAKKMETYNLIMGTVLQSLSDVEGKNRSEIRDRIYSIFASGGKLFSLLPELDKFQIRKVEDVLVKFLRTAGKNDCSESNLKIVTRAFTGG